MSVLLTTKKIIKEWKNILKTGGKKGRIPKMWDGKTAQRTADEIIEYLNI